MNTAYILPARYLESSSRYHLCLGHLVLQLPTYRRFYAERARRGDFVILDNSAHEHGRGEPGEALAAAANLISPSLIVLPDVLFDAQATIEASAAALPHIQKTGIPYAVVPQGRTFDEWMGSLDELMSLEPALIGISKDFEFWDPRGLTPLIQYALQYQLPLHLLGWGRRLHLLPDYLAEGSGKILGVDSAKPAVYAYFGVALPEDLSTAPPYPGRPKRFFKLSRTEIDLGLLRHNLEVFTRAAGGASSEVPVL